MSRHVTTMTIDDAEHYTPERRQEIIDSYLPHEREARARGIPTLGAGVIYPVPESAFVVEPFEIPEWWPKAYGMDVGWNTTAAIWGAWDRDSDTVYLYSEHYRGLAEPSIHADAIKARGEWIMGAIDPASAGANQKDGTRLIDEYRKLGLQIVPAENTVEAGIHAVYRRLSGGRLKVFRNCTHWLGEFRIYRRDENGKVVKERDHLMDSTRYLILTGMKYATTEPRPANDDYERYEVQRSRSSVTGY